MHPFKVTQISLSLSLRLVPLVRSLQRSLSALWESRGCSFRMAQQQQQHQQQQAKTKTKTTTKTKRINRFLCVPRFLYIWKMKTTITTTVKAAGEAFAELDTIVVVAHVVCTFVVSLQLFVVVLVSLNRIQLSVVVVVLVVVLRISRVLIFSKCKSNYAIQNRKLNLLNWKMSRNFELFWNSLMNLIRK